MSKFWSADVQIGSYVLVAYGVTEGDALEGLEATIRQHVEGWDCWHTEDWQEYYGANIYECELGKGYVR